MSRPHVKLARPVQGILGCNIKITPGGFSHHIGNRRTSTRTYAQRKAREASQEAVKAAAEEALQRHGFTPRPNDFVRTAQPNLPPSCP